MNFKSYHNRELFLLLSLRFVFECQSQNNIPQEENKDKIYH